MKEISKRGGPHSARRKYDRREAGTTGRRSSRSRQVYVARRRKAASIGLAACALLAVVALWASMFGGDEIRRGVRIGEVDVGGMTREEARAAVERHAADAFDEVRLGDKGPSVTGEKLGVTVDAAGAAEEAYLVGRQGGVGARVLDTLRSYLGGVRVAPEISYDKEAARAAVEKLAGEFHREPQNASFRVADDGKVEIQEAKDGRVLDQEDTLENLDRSLTGLDSEISLVVHAEKPSVTTDEIDRLRPTEVIGDYKTDFLWDSNPARQENMELAANAVNNTVVAPGEVFSFNELTSSLEYGQAKTFSEGGVAYADGGGLCQVSSTLYMAANYAGLEIVERNPHFAVLPYIKPGFDATVWFGGDGIPELDMKFENTTDGYIVIREWVDEDGFLNAEILGRPTGKKVEMRTEKVFEDPARGIKWSTYKKVTNEDGEVIRDGLLHTYVYGYNPPAPDGPHYETSAPRVAGWNDPTNTTGWADVE